VKAKRKFIFQPFIFIGVLISFREDILLQDFEEQAMPLKSGGCPAANSAVSCLGNAWKQMANLLNCKHKLVNKKHNVFK